MTLTPPAPAPEFDACTRDAFLGGRLHLWQPRTGYRAATDPVLLAAAVPARAGQTVLDIGCGAGVAGLCLAARVRGLTLTGLEIQPRYAALARRNAAENTIPMEIVIGDVSAPPPALQAEQFDHVLTNPPFFPADAITPPVDSGRATAHAEGAASLERFIDLALRRARPGGTVTVIHRAERLGDILRAFGTRAGDIRVLPLSPRAGQPAKRVIVQGRKGRRSPLRLLAPIVIHTGTAHVRDGASYTPLVQSVLEQGAPLPLGAD